MWHNQTCATLPDWLSVPDPPRPKPVAERKLLTNLEYEALFPIVMEKVAGGSILSRAINDDVRDLDTGAFLAWLRKDKARLRIYNEAKEMRTEVWAGKTIEYAEGIGMEDVQRSKLIVDTYFRLMEADNRKVYGRSQQIDVTSTISITAALDSARQRAGITIDHDPSPTCLPHIEQIETSDGL